MATWLAAPSVALRALIQDLEAFFYLLMEAFWSLVRMALLFLIASCLFLVAASWAIWAVFLAIGALGLIQSRAFLLVSGFFFLFLTWETVLIGLIAV